MPLEKNVSFWKKFVHYISAPENAVPLKIAIFCFAGGAICVFPFMVLQMKMLGLTIKEIALIYLVIPIASLLGPVTSGIIADKIGKYNIVLAVNMTLTICFFNLLLIVPAISLPPATITCTKEAGCIFILNNCENCMQNTTTDVSFNIKDCKYLGNETKSEIQLKQEKYSQNNQVTLYGNYSGNCVFNVLEVVSVNSNSSLDLDSGRDIKCGVDWNSECYEDMKTLYSNSFWQFILYKFIGNFFASAAFTMSDASILALAKKHNLSVGKQKIMTMLAFATAPIFSGILIDYHSNIVGYKSYFAAFMLATSLTVCAIIIISFLKIEAETGSGNMMKDIKKLLTHKEVVLFYVILLILGTNFGFIESYIFIYLTSLGASGFLLGFTLTVGCTFSIPMLFYADKLEEKIGRRNIYLICFTCYAIRMVGYSYIWNPWLGLCFEIFEAFTYQLMWVTCLKIFPLLAPKGLLATMTGIAGAIHYSFGKGLGGFLGGQLIERVGMRLAFRFMAITALLGAVFYYVIDKLVLKEKFAEKDKEHKEEMLQKKMMDYSNNSNGKENFLVNSHKYNKDAFIAVCEIPLDEMNKKDYWKNMPTQIKTDFAHSMPHLYDLSDLSLLKRHSIGAGVSSGKLLL